jgi:hypothetical protein
MDNNSFDAYLEDVHLSLEEFKERSQERQDAERDRFIEWLRSRTAIAKQQLAPVPTPAPGII